jgi:hypothetical protein
MPDHKQAIASPPGKTVVEHDADTAVTAIAEACPPFCFSFELKRIYRKPALRRGIGEVAPMSFGFLAPGIPA